MTYFWALFIVGVPMLILELTLGQKMQRGSAGAMRGIVPRLAGIGWVASFSGFVTSLIYNILLAMCVIYLLMSGSQPWSAKNYTRNLSCQTAEMM
jgi:SNF family Na+-dependent transporter